MKNERRTPENESGIEKGQVQGSEVSGPLSGRACGLFSRNSCFVVESREEGFPVSLPTRFLNFYLL